MSKRSHPPFVEAVPAILRNPIQGRGPASSIEALLAMVLRIPVSTRQTRERARAAAHRRGGGRARRGVVAWLLAEGVLGLSGPALAETGTPLTRYVPASAGLFVGIRRLDEFDRALHRARAWRFLPTLVDAPSKEGAVFDLRAAVQRLFGLRARRDVDELLASEVGLVAASWQDLRDAVWLVRVPKAETLDRWFPPGHRLGGGELGGVRLFRTRDGVTVCLRDDVAAMSRRWGPGTPFDRIMGLMAGPDGEPLQQHAGWRALAAYLPANPLAQLHLAGGAGAPERGLLDRLWRPPIDRAVVGVYEGAGRIDLAIRASLREPRRRSRLSVSAVRHLMRLPSTTLYASAASIDFSKAGLVGGPGGGRGLLDSLVDFLVNVHRLVGGFDEALPRFGPHVTFVWGQDLREGVGAPQVAVMVECADGAAVREHVRALVEKLLEFVRTAEPGAATEHLAIERDRHLTVEIAHVRLAEYAARSSRPAAKLFAHLDPAWAVWKNMLIVALSRDHIERILDAQYGLAPTLSGVPDVEALERQAAERSVVAIVQPGLATRVLGRWLSAHRAGGVSLLDPRWWQGGVSAMRDGFGAVFGEAEGGGFAVVTSVRPGSPASGLLRVDDEVVGVDGALLPLDAPHEALGRLLSEARRGGGVVLRVLRDGRCQDVVIPLPERGGGAASLRMKPADAIAELVSLGRTLRFASFAVNATDERHYAARLTLRFTRRAGKDTADATPRRGRTP